MSDAIDSVLEQVVRCGELPLHAHEHDVRIVSSRRLWAMKRAAQARDRGLVERGEVLPEEMLFLRPHRVQSVQVDWPDASCFDD